MITKNTSRASVTKSMGPPVAGRGQTTPQFIPRAPTGRTLAGRLGRRQKVRDSKRKLLFSLGRKCPSPLAKSMFLLIYAAPAPGTTFLSLLVVEFIGAVGCMPAMERTMVTQRRKSSLIELSEITRNGFRPRFACLEAEEKLFLRKLEPCLYLGLACGKGCRSRKSYFLDYGA